jgi:hypothetical protein
VSGRVLLACGGYRSGSTLLYNLIGEYVERANLGRRIGFVEPEQAAVLPRVWSFVDSLSNAVAKCHLAPASGDGSETWGALVADGRVLPVYTVRDWRDVVHSWSRMFDQDLEQVFAHPRWRLNLDNLESWMAVGARVQRYERLVADPAAELQAVAGWADLPVIDEAVPAAAAAALDVAAPADADDVDRRTLLHRRHVADPQGGAWRTWSAAQRDLVRRHVDPLMERFGYAWD